MNYVITTSALGSSKTQIWNPETPLPLGHPFQWVLEKTPEGLRIRDIASLKRGIVVPTQEIPNADLQKGAEVQLKGHSPIALKIRQAKVLPPAYQEKVGQGLTVYACTGNWVQSSTLLAPEGYTGKRGHTEIFVLKKVADLYAIYSKTTDVEIHGKFNPAKVLNAGESLQLSAEDLADSSIQIGSHSWRFGLSSRPQAPALTNEESDPETRFFVSALRYTTIAFIAFVALSWILPKPKEDKELIPTQFAKIVLSKPKVSEPKKASAATSMAEAAAKSAPKKVQDAAVVQAFRAKALNNAVSGLLKGGMTQLLAQSDFVAGTQASKDARRIFDNKSTALKATGPETGSMTSKNVKIASLGGETGKGGVGYAKGEHANVKGQGGAFVTMDTSGSFVDEGLTKDEVGEVIHRHLSEVRYCYESAMLRTPDVEGKLLTNFVIGGSGMVKSSEVKSSSLPDARLDDCILRRLATWKFPNPRGGIDVAVTYPFIFKTLGR